MIAVEIRTYVTGANNAGNIEKWVERRKGRILLDIFDEFFRYALESPRLDIFTNLCYRSAHAITNLSGFVEAKQLWEIVAQNGCLRRVETFPESYAEFRLEAFVSTLDIGQS